jgi:hypothetical protein
MDITMVPAPLEGGAFNLLSLGLEFLHTQDIRFLPRKPVEEPLPGR